MVNGLTEGIRIKEHAGSWHIIDKETWKGKPVYLLEHEEYGTDANLLIVYENGDILASTNDLDGFDRLQDLD